MLVSVEKVLELEVGVFNFEVHGAPGDLRKLHAILLVVLPVNFEVATDIAWRDKIIFHENKFCPSHPSFVQLLFKSANILISLNTLRSQRILSNHRTGLSNVERG